MKPVSEHSFGNTEPRFGSVPNLAGFCLTALGHFSDLENCKYVTSFDDVTKTLFAKKSQKFILCPTPRATELDRVIRMTSKFRIDMPNTCGHVNEGFKNFKYFSNANHGVKKSKNGQKSSFLLGFT